MNEKVIRCARCVMDNSSDATIYFDNEGICNYCTDALREKEYTYFPDNVGKDRLESILTEIRKAGQGRRFDCIMGLSGGLDSSYLAYLGYKWGLRVLAVHIDDGYDTEISKHNLDSLVAATGFEYKVITPDEAQYSALLKAYMYAGVPNIAIPQDNVLFAFIYKMMRKYKINYFLTGGNFALESILQRGNTYKASDVVNIKDINKRFGTMKTDKLSFISTTRQVFNERILGIKTPRLLNYIDYNRDRAFSELNEFCGFQYYGRKHLENELTAFIQLYWFPQKFGVDKRTSHLSSMIVSNQMTREKALLDLEEPLYEEEMMNNYITKICSRLSITKEEFADIMSAPTHQHDEFQIEDNKFWYKMLKLMHKWIR